MLICIITDCVLIIIVAITCYVSVAYLEHKKKKKKKKIDMIDRGMWKPEEKQERPEHKLITGYNSSYWGWRF